MPKRQQFPYPGSWVPGTESDTYRLEPMIASVVDLTSQTPAIAGKVLVAQYVATNTSGAYYSQNATAAAKTVAHGYGIVYAPAESQGLTADVIEWGFAVALAVTDNTTSITPGVLLTTDSAGNVTASSAYATGTVIGIALSTMATGTTIAAAINMLVGKA